MKLALFATPGRSRHTEAIEAELRSQGWEVAYIARAGMSRVFVQAAQAVGPDVLQGTLRRYAAGVQPDALGFIGFSAWCWYAREGLLQSAEARAALDWCVFIDGLHATDAQLAPVRAYLAEGGRVLNIHSDTPTYGYPSTTETVHTLGTHANLTTVHRPGSHDFRTLFVPEALRTWLPSVPLDAPEAPKAIPPERYALGIRALAFAHLMLGVAETPSPRTHNPLILDFQRAAERGGANIGGALQRDESPWCATFASWCMLQALAPGEHRPHPPRAAVRELYEDARKAGTLVGVAEARPGDLLLMTRGAPASSAPYPFAASKGLGHVGRIERVKGDVIHTIDGNTSNAVRRREYPRNDPHLVGVVRYPGEATDVGPLDGLAGSLAAVYKRRHGLN